MNDWESITAEDWAGGSEYLERLSVPGGWLYRTTRCDEESSTSLCFVPDHDEMFNRLDKCNHAHQRREWKRASYQQNLKTPDKQ